MLRIKEILKEKSVTGKELADIIGVSKTSMSAIVSGQSFPKPETLKAIAEALDVDIRDLFQPTKESAKETIYIKKGNEYKAIGEVDLTAIEGENEKGK